MNKFLFLSLGFLITSSFAENFISNSPLKSYTAKNDQVKILAVNNDGGDIMRINSIEILGNNNQGKCKIVIIDPRFTRKFTKNDNIFQLTVPNSKKTVDMIISNNNTARFISSHVISGKGGCIANSMDISLNIK